MNTNRMETMIAALVIGIGIAVSLGSVAHAEDGAAAADAEKLARGKYLVTIAGCNDCHTPWKVGPNGPEPDMSRMLSGHPQEFTLQSPRLTPGPWPVAMAATNTAFAGPWGVSFAANLTPDGSGLGPWTEDIFIQTIRTGKHWGQSRPILPPMPWPMYRNMTDDDLKAVFAFLRTIPPIENHVPLPLPPASEAVAESDGWE